jgi:hypothetical protein
MTTGWLATGRNPYNATFTTLPAGNYQFRVKAVDHNSGLSDEAAIKLVIKPAHWLSLPAKMGYVLLLITSVFGVIYWRTNNFRKTPTSCSAAFMNAPENCTIKTIYWPTKTTPVSTY